MIANITEHKALNQAKKVFNNSYKDIVEHFKEECLELIEEFEYPEGLQNKAKINDELADVAYMFNQLASFFGTNYQGCLTFAINKIEQRKKSGYYDKRPV